MSYISQIPTELSPETLEKIEAFAKAIDPTCRYKLVEVLDYYISTFKFTII